MAGKGRGRKKPRLDEHLYLRGGVWWTRIARDGRERRASTGCPESERARARQIRDERLARFAMRADGVEELTAPKTLGEIVEMYLEEESQPYAPGERGLRRPGLKRSSENDRLYRDRLFAAGLDRSLSAALIDEERLLEAVQKREKSGAAPLTIRNDFRFLSRVYRWARSKKRKSGVRVSPFDGLDGGIQRRLFPRVVRAKIRPFRRDELLKLYELLPAYAYRPTRFTAHTGLRLQETLSLKWGQISLEERLLRISPDVAKNFTEREVPLNDVALAMLRQIRPEGATADAPVFLNDEGGPLRDLRGSLKTAVEKACEPPRPGYRWPTFHSLRKTCATALEAVASKAVAGMVLGHSAADVTDLYIQPSFEDALAALNRAALLIDGNVQENVAIFSRIKGSAAETAHQTAQRSIS